MKVIGDRVPYEPGTIVRVKCTTLRMIVVSDTGEKKVECWNDYSTRLYPWAVLERVPPEHKVSDLRGYSIVTLIFFVGFITGAMLGRGL